MFHSNELKLLLDENIPKKLIELLSRNFNVRIVPLGSKDKVVAEQAKSEERILLTSDTHFLNKIKFPPREFSGIIFIDIHPPLIETIHFSLDRLFETVDSSKFKGRLFKLTTSGFKVFPKL